MIGPRFLLLLGDRLAGVDNRLFILIGLPCVFFREKVEIGLANRQIGVTKTKPPCLIVL
jgi:hypothetical protein